MTPDDLAARIRAELPEAVLAVVSDQHDPWIEVRAQDLAEVAGLLRDDEALRFEMLNCISGVDYVPVDPKQRRGSKGDWSAHLEVVYHLTSLSRRERIVLKVLLPRWKDDMPGRLPEVPTLCDVYGTAEWHEREVYDLIGVQFVGHPDMRRILCPDDWVGHPLRKDYQMPLEYHGIRGR